MEQTVEQGQLTSITWEAPEHHHIEKSGEWYAILVIITLAAAAAAFTTGNILFGMIILLFTATVSLVSLRIPATIPFAVTSRGIRIDDKLYPFTVLESYFIDEEDPKGPQLLLKGTQFFMPLLVIPIPEEDIHDIEELIASRLPEEHLEEPVFTKVLEFFGF
jgi:hypothetical protein